MLKGGWQASYAVDGHMVPYSAHYHHLSCPRFGKSSEIMVHCWPAIDSIVQWLRIKPNMEWFPYLLPTYARWLTTFIRCGWAYEAIIRPILLRVWAKIWEVFWNHSLLGNKQHHCAVAEALTQQHHGMGSISPPTYAERILTSFICCGWAYGAIFYPLPLPTLKLSQIWEGFWNYGSLLTPSTVAEAPTQHGMVPTSPSNICKVVDNLYMLWMGIWSHHQANFNKNWEVFWNYGSLLGCKWHPCAVAETLTQHGMVTISPPNIWERGAWQASYAVDGHMAPYSAHYHHLSCPRFGKSSEIMVPCWATNDTIVQLLTL